MKTETCRSQTELFEKLADLCDTKTFQAKGWDGLKPSTRFLLEDLLRDFGKTFGANPHSPHAEPGKEARE